MQMVGENLLILVLLFFAVRGAYWGISGFVKRRWCRRAAHQWFAVQDSPLVFCSRCGAHQA